MCELAPTTYMIARAYGAPYVALPIVVMRRFHHSGLVCREDSGIKVPKDLEGKKVGVRAYSVTTGVWTRGILVNEYGLDSSKVTWVVDDEEHVRELKLPPNVVHTPPGRSLAAMMADGEIQAGFTKNAGIGREGPPKADWASGDKVQAQTQAQTYYELIPDAPNLEAEWFRRTGIYPIHGLIVVKEKLLRDHPWLAKSIFTAFSEAKARYMARLTAGEGNSADDRKYRDLMPLVGDPLPYGIAVNRPAIDAMITYAVQQGLMPQRLAVDKLFVDPQA
jgi:4,5-dihydroxyphthalate decarboxylase